MTGFHAAFLVATAFGIIDFIFACFVKRQVQDQEQEVTHDFNFTFTLDLLFIGGFLLLPTKRQRFVGGGLGFIVLVGAATLMIGNDNWHWDAPRNHDANRPTCVHFTLSRLTS